MPPLRAQGRVIAGRYNLVESIGRGAMGVVWRARDSLLDRDVAIKEVLLNAAIGDEERENAYKRTMREARTAARLSHRGVVTIYDVAEEDGRPWIIMELVPSRSLDQVLESDGPLPPRRACRIGQQLLAALAAAHAAGVLHRDVKPSNVLIADDPDGERAVLTDFGIAQFAGDPRLTQTGMVMGSPGFTAPERIRGGTATPASDLWSLGATLFAAVEGHGPYEERGGAITTMTAIINEDAPPATSAGSLGPLIAALLHRNPRLRPPAAAAARMFAGVLPLLPPAPPPLRRTPTLVAAPVSGQPGAGATSQDAMPDAAPASADGSGDEPAAGTAEDPAPARAVLAPSAGAAEEAGDSEEGTAGSVTGDSGTSDSEAQAGSGADAVGADTPEEVSAPEGIAAEGSATEAPAGHASDAEERTDDGVTHEDTAPEATAAEEPGAEDAGADDGGAEDAPAAETPGTADTGTETADDADAPEADTADGGTEGAPEPSEAAPLPAKPPAASAEPAKPVLTLTPGFTAKPAAMPQPAAPPRPPADRGDPPTKPQPPFSPLAGPLPRPRRRGRWAVAAVLALLVVAAIGAAIALTSRHGPPAAGTSGNTAVSATSLPDPVKAIDTPVQAPPAGWRRDSVSPSGYATAGGFTVAVPAGWTIRQRKLSTFLRAPDGVGYLDIDLTTHDRPDMRAEAEYVEQKAVAEGRLPGYHRLSLQPVSIRGTTGAFWSFTWVTASGVTMQVNDLLFDLRTATGIQSYAVDLTAPAARFQQRLPLFDQVLRTFQPVTS